MASIGAMAIWMGSLVGAGDAEPAPDVVEFGDGRRIEGRVVYEDETKLVLLANTRTREIDRKEVASVRAVRLELPSALDAIQALGPRDLAAHLALADALDARNLPREARLVRLRVLTFAPDDERANVALGHRKRGESWTLPHSGRWYRLRDRERLLADFGEAWELETTHFRVRSNLPLAATLDLALDLEQTYRGFYDVLGAELELWEITEPVEASVHADAASFPESVDGGRSYYAQADRRLYVNAAQGFELSTLVHEATHALLHHSAEHTREGRGDIPGWLGEGLAEYMEASFVGKSGAIRFEPGRHNRAHFMTHATAEDPFRLNRVLNFQSGDFAGTSNTSLKYAQSYTLVHFGLHGEDGRHRAAFFGYLRGAYAGQGSSTHFKKAWSLRESELEAAWLRHAVDPPRAGAAPPRSGGDERRVEQQPPG